MGEITTAPKMATRTPYNRLYSRAEIANMNPRQYREYEASLKLARDSYSITQTIRNEKNAQNPRRKNRRTARNAGKIRNQNPDK